MVAAINPELDTTAMAVLTVPRHKFVPSAWKDIAYADQPIPLGKGQTISAPGIVADFCDHLALEPGDKTLEIGTGCGYHAAVSAEIVGPENVFSIEFDPETAKEATERLDGLGYESISMMVGDGRDGWPAEAPFDKCYITCAVEDFPSPLIDQLVTNGLIVGPIGIVNQRLILARKLTDGSLDRLDCGAVQFVPMQGPSKEFV